MAFSESVWSGKFFFGGGKYFLGQVVVMDSAASLVRREFARTSLAARQVRIVCAGARARVVFLSLFLAPCTISHTKIDARARALVPTIYVMCLYYVVCTYARTRARARSCAGGGGDGGGTGRSVYVCLLGRT